MLKKTANDIRKIGKDMMETLFTPIFTAPVENKWTLVDFEPLLPIAVCVKRACLSDGQRILMLSRLRFSQELHQCELLDFFEKLENAVSKQPDFDGVMIKVQLNSFNPLMMNNSAMALLQCPIYNFLLNVAGYFLVNIASDLWLYKSVKR